MLHVFVRLEKKKFKDTFFWSLLTMAAFSLGLSGHYSPRKPAIRLYLSVMFLYGINFSASYQSFLILALTKQRYYSQVETVSQAMENDFSFVGGESSKIFFDNESILGSVKNVYKVCENLEQCLLQIKENRYLAVAISREHAINTPSDISESDMFCFSKANNIYTFFVVMLVKKDYHLLPQINTIIRRMKEGGLTTKWIEDSEKKGTGRTTDTGEAKPLRIEHIWGMLLVLTVGLILALMVFFLEHLTHFLVYKKHSKRAKYFEDLFFFAE